MGLIRYAQGRIAWGLCGKCGLRFYLWDLLFDGAFRSMRVCRECYDDKQPQEFAVNVTDVSSVYNPSPENTADPPFLTVKVSGTYRSLSWTPAIPHGGSRIDSYLVFQAGVLIATLPVTYWADVVPLADLVENGNPLPGNDGIKSQTLTYSTSTEYPVMWQVFSQDDFGNQTQSNMVTA